MTTHSELPEPPPQEIVGPDGRSHRMRIRLSRVPSGMLAEAEEVGAGPEQGYRFALASGPDVDPDELVAALREQVRAGISRLYLRESTAGAGWELRDDEVAGRLVPAGDGAPHSVVVDGRELSWAEFGQLLDEFEGRSFRLWLDDVPEHADQPEADVLPMPVADPAALGDLLGMGFDEMDEEEFLQQWDEAEREAAALVREALPDVVAATPPSEALRAAAARIRTGVRTRAWPYQYVAAAAGWGRRPPANDVELWVAAAGALIALREESGMGSEAESALMTLEHADWIGAVVGLARAGVGSPAEPPALLRYVNDLPEVEGEIDPDDASFVEAAFELVLPVWEAVGAIDTGRRLTRLGWWGLPRALSWAWGADLDDPADPDDH